MARTQYQTTLQNTKPHDKHEPTDNEIVTNSSITLQPIHAQDTESAQPIPLDTLNQSLTQLLNNTITHQEWIINEIITRGIKLNHQSKFTSEYARKTLPTPTYPKGTIAVSRRETMDKAEAYRIMVSWEERRDIDRKSVV